MKTTALATREIKNLSWMMYWVREELKRLYRLEAERIQWETDNELLYGINWKLKRAETDRAILI